MVSFQAGNTGTLCISPCFYAVTVVSEFPISHLPMAALLTLLYNLSMPSEPLELRSPVLYLKGVGPQRAEILLRIGIRRVSDLLFYFSRDYQDMTERRDRPTRRRKFGASALQNDRVHPYPVDEPRFFARMGGAFSPGSPVPFRSGRRELLSRPYKSYSQRSFR